MDTIKMIAPLVVGSPIVRSLIGATIDTLRPAWLDRSSALH